MSDLTDSTKQPSPVPNDGPSAHDLVISDMRERKAFGLRKYGTTLQPGNGRDGLVDLYQELLDAVAYTRLLIAERDAPSAVTEKRQVRQLASAGIISVGPDLSERAEEILYGPDPEVEQLTEGNRVLYRDNERLRDALRAAITALATARTHATRPWLHSLLDDAVVRAENAAEGWVEP
jgi:hypothetical protein